MLPDPRLPHTAGGKHASWVSPAHNVGLLLKIEGAEKSMPVFSLV